MLNWFFNLFKKNDDIDYEKVCSMAEYNPTIRKLVKQRDKLGRFVKGHVGYYNPNQKRNKLGQFVKMKGK